MFSIWWRSVLAKLATWKSASRRQSRRRNGPHLSTYRVCFESLEDRFAPSTTNWQGGAIGTWNSASNWTAGIPNATLDAAFPTAGDYIVTLNGAQNAKGVSFAAGANVSIASGGSYALTIGTDGITSASATTDSIAAQVALGAAQTWNVGSSSALNVSGAVANGGNLLSVSGAGCTTISGAITGTGGLTEATGGTLFLSGPNLYTGATTVQAGGTIQAQNKAAFGTTAVTVSAGATLQLANNITIANSLTLTGTLDNVSGNNTYSGAIRPATTGSAFQSDAGTMTVSNWSPPNANGIVLTFQGAGNMAITNNVVFGNYIGALNKTGSGTLNIQGNWIWNTSPTWTVYGGVLDFSGANGYFPQTAQRFVINAGGTLLLDNTGASVNNRLSPQTAAPVTLAGGSLAFLGNNTTETLGALTLNAGHSTIYAANVSGNAALTFASITRNTSGGTVNFSNVVPSFNGNTTTGAVIGNPSNRIVFTKAPVSANTAIIPYAMVTGGASSVDFATDTGNGTSIVAFAAYNTGNPSGLNNTSIYKVTSPTTLSANTTIGGLLIGSGATLTVNSDVTLTDRYVLATTLGSSGTDTISGGTLAVGAEGIFLTGNSNTTDNITSAVTGAAVTTGGTGTLNLSSTSSSYTGVTTIGGGTLAIASIGNLSSNSSLGTRPPRPTARSPCVLPRCNSLAAAVRRPIAWSI